MSKLAFVSITGTPLDDGLTATQLFDAATDTYEIVTEISGGYGNDALAALSAPVFQVDGQWLEFAVTLKGEAGDDTLIGGGLPDMLIGGTGNDTIRGGLGADILQGGEGDDVLLGDPDGGTAESRDYLDGGQGSDTYLVPGPQGVRSIIFDSGTTGTDTLAVSGTNFSMFGPFTGVERIAVSGDPRIYGTADPNVLDFSAVQDMAEVASVSGRGGDDVITGNAQSNVLLGGEGDDNLAGGGGNDVLAGDAGIDTADYSAAMQAVRVDLRLTHRGAEPLLDADGPGPAPDSVAELLASLPAQSEITDDVAGIANGAETGTDLLFGIENATGGAGNDILTGNIRANRLTGNDGDDDLDGGAGADHLSGGRGNDTYRVDDAGDTITEARGGGLDTIVSTIAWALRANVENLVLAGHADIDGIGNNLDNALTGNDGANLLSGGNGDDVLTGNSGDDVLSGGSGNDTMSGGAGNDIYYVERASDVVIDGLGGIDTVKSRIDYALGADIENLVLLGGALRGIGNALDNVMTAYDGDNDLDGGAGADRLAGGNGNDTYIVDSTGDIVAEINPDPATGGIDQVFSSVSFSLSNNVENLTLSGDAAINGSGNALSNIITGNSASNNLNGGDGNDRLDGGGGEDWLRGGRGADHLTGGAGNDHFLFVAGEVDGDVVVDFDGKGGRLGDTLRFSGFGPGAELKQLDATRWEISYGPGHADSEIITFLNGASISPRDYVLS